MEIFTKSRQHTLVLPIFCWFDSGKEEISPWNDVSHTYFLSGNFEDADILLSDKSSLFVACITF